MRRLLVLAAISVLAGSLLAQPAGTKPLAFEVASIKPTKPGAQAGGIRPMPGGQTYVASGVSLRLMIQLMFKLSDAQLTGGPAWISTDPWDVNAKAERPSTLDQLHEMFQTLL